MYTKGVHLWNQTRLNIVSPVTATHNLPTYLTAPSAAQLAGDTLTLGTLRSTPLPGGTADLPYNNLAIYGFQQALVGYHPWGNSRYNGLARADEQALLEEFLVHRGVHLEPQFRRFHGHQLLHHSVAAPRTGLPESCGRNGLPPRSIAGTVSP